MSSDRNPFRAPAEPVRGLPGLVPPQVRTMSIASIFAAFVTAAVLGLVARLANTFGVPTGDPTLRATLSFVAGALLGLGLGVVALRRSRAYPPSVVRTQAIAGIVVSVLCLVWCLYHVVRGT